MKTDLIDVIDSYAKTKPDDVVYHYNDQINTYLDLKHYSDALAKHLDEMRLPNNRPILVFGDKSFAMIATFLAVIKSGHSYIPVDVDSPDERLILINKIAQPVAVIAVDDLPVNLGEVPVISAPTLSDIFQQPVDYQVTHAVSDDQTFYIIFTSGTTGVPKGVEISYNNLLSFVTWIAGTDFNLPENLQMLQQPAYSFDLSVMSLYPTLFKGGTLHVLSKKMTDNFLVLFTALPTLSINVWVSTPSFINICLLEPSFNSTNYPQLKHFLFCGEELTTRTARMLKQKFPQAHIFNTYGPTESTVAITQVEITNEMINEFDRLPIGYIMPGMHARIIDDDGNPVLDGSQGELQIFGTSVSHNGYINNPEKTKKAFSIIHGQNAYRTGDIAKIRQDGLIQYFGRRDFQVKMNGYRIELEDVAILVGKQKYVKQTAVVPKYNAQHQVSVLIAYIVPNENHFNSELELTAAIKRDLKESMMSYMIPQKIIYRKSLPLSKNGKIDIKSMINEANSQ
ncbi:MAG: D-alanine--poly(phosphoribitol) ligase subunit DltA [Lentilactobacillus diolivorans]|uniref:D-alanine--poly(phosphoribitol) ligase subunit DltA n=1 Tax=Lentilactobacillus diolivorans TaxID=179838 RepID=UPI000FF47A2A|nr:D-alanine--poly(phosphoribitol) ligase subunit DltA [Lentilactobacillus diolivorans]RRG02973.1 MAG: D-alanine--poly(phosphoribitol) ligase subunit 1 [Lactobacillus sp.]